MIVAGKNSLNAVGDRSSKTAWVLAHRGKDEGMFAQRARQNAHAGPGFGRDEDKLGIDRECFLWMILSMVGVLIVSSRPKADLRIASALAVRGTIRSLAGSTG